MGGLGAGVIQNLAVHLLIIQEFVHELLGTVLVQVPFPSCVCRDLTLRVDHLLV